MGSGVFIPKRNWFAKLEKLNQERLGIILPLLIKISSKYQFLNEPRILAFSDYDRVKQQAIERLIDMTDVQSVYTFGTSPERVNDPGISDLDILFVVETLKNSTAQDYADISEMDAVSRYILVHNLGFVVSEQVLRKIRSVHWAPTFEYYWEAKKKISIGEISSDEQTLSCITNIINKAISNYPFLREILFSEKINVRLAFKVMRGLKHDIERMKFLGIYNGKWDGLIDDVIFLRQKWIFLEQTERNGILVALLQKARDVYRDIIGRFSRYLIEERFIERAQGNKQQSGLEYKDNRSIIFSDELWEKDIKAGIRALDLIPLPFAMCFYFYAQARYDTPFGRIIRQRLYPSVNEYVDAAVIPYAGELEKQAVIYNECWQFLQVNNFVYGLCPFVNRFRDERNARGGIINRIRNIVRRVIKDVLSKHI